MFPGSKFFARSIGYGEHGGVNFLKIVAATITMDTSTGYMDALEMPLNIFLECYETLSHVSQLREDEMKKSLKNK